MTWGACVAGVGLWAPFLLRVGIWTLRAQGCLLRVKAGTTYIEITWDINAKMQSPRPWPGLMESESLRVGALKLAF